MRVKSRRAAGTKPSAPAERPAQRRRTRKAIVEAAMSLLAKGDTPSVTDVARAADVSRRTVYLYFPSFDHLLLDATVGVLAGESVDRALADGNLESNAEARVERLVRALQEVSPRVERLGRELVRLTVTNGPGADGSDRPRRGYRRVAWIETALAPWRGRLDERRWKRLVAALAVIIGWEALIAQRDVCGLTVSEGADLSAWAAHALMKQTLSEVGSTQAGKPAKTRTPDRE